MQHTAVKDLLRSAQCGTLHEQLHCRAFGAPWEIRLGRVDCDGSANAGRALKPKASTEEIVEFMNKLGTKPGPRGFFDPKPRFWERPTFVLYPAMQDDPIVRASWCPDKCQ